MNIFKAPESIFFIEMIIDLGQATTKIIKLQTHTRIQKRINNNNLYPVQYSHNTKTGLRL